MGEWRSLGNPCVGGSELDMATTFFSQATAVMPLPGQPGRFLFMADQWDVRDLGRSRRAPGPDSSASDLPSLRGPRHS